MVVAAQLWVLVKLMGGSFTSRCPQPSACQLLWQDFGQGRDGVHHLQMVYDMLGSLAVDIYHVPISQAHHA